MQVSHFITLKIQFALLFLISFATLKAQDNRGEVWMAYIGSISLSENWKIWHDYQYVSNAFAVVRPGITYQTLTGYQFTAGYGYVVTTIPNSTRLEREEHRFWGQAIKRFQLHSKLNYIVRFRYDARFRQSLGTDGEIIENERTFNHRFRLMQSVRFRLSPNNQENYWRIDIINETLLNSGNAAINGLDQIRNYVLLGYSLPNLTLLAGYHQRLIPGKSHHWNLNQGFTFWCIHNINIFNRSQEIE